MARRSMNSTAVERLARRPATGAWSDSVVTTGRANIAVRQTPGSKTAILLLPDISSPPGAFDDLMETRIGRDYRMIAIEWPKRRDGGEVLGEIAERADAALEVLESLGVDAAVVLDASPDGRVGREMMTIFPGLLGLAILGNAAPEKEGARRADGAPIFELPQLHPAVVDLMMKNMEAREAARLAAPTLWYGG